MPFIPNDTYLTRGENSLDQTTWTSSVYKFDASTFYNWEQDNLPLYDIEERTYEMWEQDGFPTSSVTGFALTVSADTPTATLNANNNIFNLILCICCYTNLDHITLKDGD